MARPRLASLVVGLCSSILAAGCGDNLPFTPDDMDAAQSFDAHPPDAAGLAVIAEPSSLTIAEGGSTDSFSIKLSRAPVGSLTVAIASSDEGAATVSLASLTFDATNFADEQFVTVTPVSDDDAASETVTITASATGAASDTVAVTVSDDDELGIVATPAAIDVVEGASATVAVSLSAQPPADVTVTVASGNTDAITAAVGSPGTELEFAL